jgi:hypothetical protein
VSPIDDSVNYRIGDGGLAEELVPVFVINLAGHDGRAVATPVF